MSAGETLGLLAVCFTWPQYASNRHDNQLSWLNVATLENNRQGRAYS